MSKQTAIEYLMSQLPIRIVNQHMVEFDRAKAMEKEQMEISDKEIQQEANERHYGTNFQNVFASGAKWYREKLNQTYKEDKQ